MHSECRRTELIRTLVAKAVTATFTLGLLVSPVAEARKTPPAKRTYFVIYLGLEGGYETNAACTRFDKRRVCTADGEVCGSWEHSQVLDKEMGFSFEIELTENEIPVVIEADARLDDRLRRSSFGGAATISIDGQVGNFALVGREVKPALCSGLVEDFEARAAVD